MLFALQTKFDYIAHKIADDCTSLCSARFTTTTHKTDSSLSLVLFMLVKLRSVKIRSHKRLSKDNLLSMQVVSIAMFIIIESLIDIGLLCDTRNSQLVQFRVQ